MQKNVVKTTPLKNERIPLFYENSIPIVIGSKMQKNVRKKGYH